MGTSQRERNARSSECTEQYAQKTVDTTDIVGWRQTRRSHDCANHVVGKNSLRARFNVWWWFPFLSLRLMPAAKPARPVPCAKLALPCKTVSRTLGRPGLRREESKSANLAVAFPPSAPPRRRRRQGQPSRHNARPRG